jgi:hypothetical protein
MALVTRTVTFTPTFGSTATLIEYKEYGANTWVVPSSPPNPTTGTSYPLQLEEGKSYYIGVSAIGTQCSPRRVIKAISIPPPTTTTTTTSTSTTTTTSSTTTTTTTGAPVPVQEITDLGTPNSIVFNGNNNLMYYIDFDTIGNLSITDGGVGYFNPLTATNISDITYPISARGMMLEHMAYNQENNKLFIHGRKSGGMVVYNCATNTVMTTIPYGSNGNSVTTRQKVYSIGDKIYGGYAAIGGFVVVDPSTNNQLPDFVPPNVGTYATFRMVEVGTELWLFETSSASTPSRVLIYNINDITTPIHTITDIDDTLAVSGTYEISDTLYYDSSNNKIWFVSYGGFMIKAISTISRTVVNNTPIPSEGKQIALMQPIYRASSNTLYISGALADSFSDPGIQRMYQIDKTTGNILATFTDLAIGHLSYCPLNNNNYAVVPGRASFNVPNTGYDTDGKIITYN